MGGGGTRDRALSGRAGGIPGDESSAHIPGMAGGSAPAPVSLEDLAAGRCVGLTDFTEWDVLEQLHTCSECPVKAKCLTYSLEQESQYAAKISVVYGGKTGQQRAAILKARTANKPMERN